MEEKKKKPILRRVLIGLGLGLLACVEAKRDFKEMKAIGNGVSNGVGKIVDGVKSIFSDKPAEEPAPQQPQPEKTFSKNGNWNEGRK